MTTSEITRLRALCEKATPGPWASPWDSDDDERHANPGILEPELANMISSPTRPVVGVSYFDGPNIAVNEPDAAFIAAARTALPELLDEVERLNGEIIQTSTDRNYSHADFIVASEEIAAIRAAWRVMQEPDIHLASCPHRHGAASSSGLVCTCGLHARKAEARRKLEGER